MARKKKHEEHGAGERWAVPYADFLSLLLALFIALYAITAKNIDTIRALREEFIRIFDFKSADSPISPVDPKVQGAVSEADVEEQPMGTVTAVGTSSGSQTNNSTVALEEESSKVSLRLPIRIFFQLGTADLKDPSDELVVSRIVQILDKLPPNVNLDVRGFANGAISPGAGASNDAFKLSSERALKITEMLLSKKVPHNKITSTALGDSAPIEGHLSEMNDRVEFAFMMQPMDKQRVLSILDSLSNE